MHSKHLACEDLSAGKVAPEAERRCWAASAVFCGEFGLSALSVVATCGRARARPSLCGPFVGSVHRPACRHRVCGSTHSSASIPRRVSRVMWSQWTIPSRQTPSYLRLPSLSGADLSGQAPPDSLCFSAMWAACEQISNHHLGLETAREISGMFQVSARRSEGRDSFVKEKNLGTENAFSSKLAKSGLPTFAMHRAPGRKSRAEDRMCWLGLLTYGARPWVASVAGVLSQ
jgi:hypothetical protein